MRLKIIIAAVVGVAVAVAVLVGVFATQQGSLVGVGAVAPNVKFVSFDSNTKDFRVGETANIVYNVQSFEERSIDNARVTIMIEPSSYGPYLSLGNQTVFLPRMLAKNAATGEIEVSITATGSPAKEAVYTIKGLLFVEGVQTDVRQFDLKIRQQ